MLDLNSYNTSPQQLVQLDILFKIQDLTTEQGFHIYITGGYGFDALYGKLTRDHRDIDMYLSQKSEEKLVKILDSLGFSMSGNLIGTVGKKEYINPSFSETFTIEYGLFEVALGMISESDIAKFLPTEPIGFLNNKPVWTVNWFAFKKMIEFNNSPKAKNTEPYKHQEWLDTIFPEIEKKLGS